MSLKKITLHENHVALGARMVPFAGYEMPLKYSSETEEHLAVRNTAGIFDVSHMGEFFISGKDAERYIQHIVTNDVTKLSDGQAQYACLTNEQGGVIDDLLIYRFSQTSFMLVVNASNIDVDWDWCSLHAEGFDITLENQSDAYSLFAVQGPKAAAVLQTLTAVNLSGIPYYRFLTDTIAGVDEVIISATGYTGAGGFELYVKNEKAEQLYKAMLTEGAKEHLLPVGLGARDTLRLEMGYCLHGQELSTEINPLAAGLGWVTKLDKEFIGAQALREIKTAGVKQKLVGFELTERGIPRTGYAITHEGQTIGEVTSGTMSPMLKKGIGMGYIEPAYASVGQKVGIAIRNKIISAEVIKLPFIK